MLKIFLGEFMDVIKVVLYTIMMYVFLIVIIRLMGKREVGSLSIFDLAVYFTISDLITVAIVDHTIPIYNSIVSVVVLAFLQILISFVTLKSKKIRDTIDGKKSIIISNGNIDFEEMKRQRYTIDDLYNQIREKGIDSVTLIKWAILENSGKLSIITKTDSIANFPDPLISDGIIDKDNLKRLKMDEKYLLNKVKESGAKSLKEVKLCLFINDSLTFIFKNNKTFK